MSDIRVSRLCVSERVRAGRGEGVVDTLREAILEGYFTPGEHLREEKLASMLDANRGRIREALLQLDREGLVQRRRNRGAVVPRLSLQDLEEVYTLRSALESLAMRWAARNASEADVQALEEVTERFASTLVPGASVHEAARVDLAFHDRVFEAAHHTRLVRTWLELRGQVRLFLNSRRYVGAPEFREAMITGHRALIAAILSHDSDHAAHVAEDHVLTSYVRIAEDYVRSIERVNISPAASNYGGRQHRLTCSID